MPNSASSERANKRATLHDAPRRAGGTAFVAAVTMGALSLVSVSVTGAGCVRKEEHEAALRDLQSARTDAAQKGVKIVALEREIGELARRIQAADQRLTDASTQEADLTRKVDDLLVLNAELTSRLKSAGQSVEQLVTERGNLSQALADTRARLEELKKQQAAAEARAVAFRDLIGRFQKMVDAGKLSVVIRQGRMLLELPNDILFDSGRTEVKNEGRGTIIEVGKVLKTLPDRKFQVSGHTDNVKMQSTRFPSNWELSTARAVEVVKILVDHGMDPRNVSAAGYGEFAPAAPNDTAEGKSRNRRIEIGLVPSFDEMIKVAGAAEGPAPKSPNAAPTPPAKPAAPAKAAPAPAAKPKPQAH